MTTIVDQAYDWFLAELRAFVLTTDALPDEVREDMAVADYVSQAANGVSVYLNVLEDTAVADAELIGTSGDFGAEREFYQPAVVEWVVIDTDPARRRQASAAGLGALRDFYVRLQNSDNLPDDLAISSVDMNRPPVRGPRGIPAQIRAVSMTFDMLISAPSFLG